MKKVLVLFGGNSPEHDVSILSGLCIAKNLDRDKYEVTSSYIDKNSNFYLYTENNYDLNLGDSLQGLKKIDNVVDFLKQYDVLFPVLHGEIGEDGKIQGLFDFINIPYVGSKVLGSALAMDKAYAKIIFKQAGIKQTKYCFIKTINNNYIFVDDNLDEYILSEEETIDKIIDKITFPMYIKPSNSGSSIGITRAVDRESLKESIYLAKQYDYKIVIEEEAKNSRELECGVLKDGKLVASPVGEIIAADIFYDFDSKYKNDKSKTIVNPKLDKNVEEEIKKLAIKGFNALDCQGLARVDFFLDKKNNIYLNEINTIPGFTSISMYPMLFSKAGIELKELLTKIVENI